MPRGVYQRPTLRERFDSRVEKRGPDECWPWRGGFSATGYGALRVDYQQTGAHRVSFFLAHGRWPEPFCLHRCDNPACVNPAHLREGTHDDNMSDMRLRGRSASGARARHRSKLVAGDIPVIRYLSRESGLSQHAIARQYGVSNVTIHDLLSGKTWSNV